MQTKKMAVKKNQQLNGCYRFDHIINAVCYN